MEGKMFRPLVGQSRGYPKAAHQYPAKYAFGVVLRTSPTYYCRVQRETCVFGGGDRVDIALLDQITFISRWTGNQLRVGGYRGVWGYSSHQLRVGG